jgi:hypothetical protein
MLRKLHTSELRGKMSYRGIDYNSGSVLEGLGRRLFPLVAGVGEHSDGQTPDGNHSHHPVAVSSTSRELQTMSD